MSIVAFVSAFFAALAIYSKANHLKFNLQRVISNIKEGVEFSNIFTAQKDYLSGRDYNSLQQFFKSEQFYRLQPNCQEKFQFIECSFFKDLQRMVEHISKDSFIQIGQELRRKRKEEVKKVEFVQSIKAQLAKMMSVVKVDNTSKLIQAILSQRDQYKQIFQLGQKINIKELRKLQKILDSQECKKIRACLKQARINQQKESWMIQSAKTNQKLKQITYQNSSIISIHNSEAYSGFLDASQSQLDSYSNSQIKWHTYHKHIQDIQLRQELKNKQFDRILHQNTFHLIKFISKQTNIKYIAKHRYSDYQAQKFTVHVQHSDNSFHHHQNNGQFKGGIQIRTFKTILILGPKDIVRWIADIAQGIAELQTLGIYHADLSFRNTIRVRIGCVLYYKIIDFDKAYKLFQSTDKNDKSYQYTRKIFQFFQSFNSKKYARQKSPQRKSTEHEIDLHNKDSNLKADIIKHIFVGAHYSQLEKLSSLSVNQCIQLLRQHSIVSHFEQYQKLVRQLLQDNLEADQQSRAHMPFESR